MSDREERCAEISIGSTKRTTRKCADDTCLESVELNVSEYERLHENADVFVILPAIPASTGTSSSIAKIGSSRWKSATHDRAK